MKKKIIIAFIILSLLTVLPVAAAEGRITAEAAESSSSKTHLLETKVSTYKGLYTRLFLENAKGKVTWSTSDKSKGTVSSEGIVYAKKANCTFKVYAKCGGKKYTATITVDKSAPGYKKLSAKTYYAQKEEVHVRTSPSNKAYIYRCMTLNEKVTIVGKLVNSVGHVWYKTKDGFYIYSGNISKKKAAPSESTAPGSGGNTETGESTGTDKFSNGLEFEKTSDGTYIVSGTGSCKDKNIIIPAKTADGKKVTGISEFAFTSEDSFTSVSFTSSEPGSVFIIGDGAFEDCLGPGEINITAETVVIGQDAFEGNPGLASVNITAKNVFIKPEAFKCKKLVSVNISGIAGSDSTVVLMREAFEGCEKLSAVTLPSGTIKICDDAFYRCTRLTSVNIGSGKLYVGDDAFSDTPSSLVITFSGSSYNAKSIKDVSRDVDSYIPREYAE